MTEKNIRPWGKYEIIEQKKIITVNPNSKLSLQYHIDRNEEWEIIEWKCEIIIGDHKSFAEKGDKYLILHLCQHRIITHGEIVKILEKSTGIIDEEDIIRLEDDYGRIKK